MSPSLQADSLPAEPSRNPLKCYSSVFTALRPNLVKLLAEVHVSTQSAGLKKKLTLFMSVATATFIISEIFTGRESKRIGLWFLILNCLLPDKQKILRTCLRKRKIVWGNPGSLLSKDLAALALVLLVRGFPLLHINSSSRGMRYLKNRKGGCLQLTGTGLLFSPGCFLRS